jgi:dTDP-4-amino-4,6-dideoxygalactose transaminase
MKIAKKYNLKVIEDNAHGLFGKYKGNNLGSIGDLSTHSFHETKNFSCGEGGALFVRNKDFVERAEIIFEKGTNRSMFLNGQVDKYTWVDKGSSYIMSDILAALLYSQLLFYKKIQSKRELLWKNYFDQLSNWSKVNEIQLPFVPNYCEQAFHMFYMLMPSNQVRTEFIKYLAKNNISSVFHYLPLDSSSMGASIRLDDQADCTISKEVSQCIVRLPLFFDLNLNDQEKVISTVTKFKV